MIITFLNFPCLPKKCEFSKISISLKWKPTLANKFKRRLSECLRLSMSCHDSMG